MNKLKKKNQNKMKGTATDNLQLLLLQVPGIILVFLFSYLPMYGIIVAFKKFNPNLGIWGSKWVGLKNFEFFFKSQDKFIIIRNTVLYNLWFMVIGLVAAVAIALMMYNLRKRYLVKTYNTIMILPRFLSSVLIAYIVYALLNPASGVINQLLVSMGSKAVDWYAKPEAWPFILTIVYIWQHCGYDSIIYYAALMGINPELFEAATIDGANKWQQTWNIAIPELVSLMIIKTILAFGSIFGGDFGLFYQTTRNVSALYPTTDIINTYTFRLLMENNRPEVSAAIGLVQSVVGLFLIVTVNLVVKKISPEDSLF